MKAVFVNKKSNIKIKDVFNPKPHKTEVLKRYLIPVLKAGFSLTESDFYRSLLLIRDAALS